MDFCLKIVDFDSLVDKIKIFVVVSIAIPNSQLEVTICKQLKTHASAYKLKFVRPCSQDDWLFPMMVIWQNKNLMGDKKRQKLTSPSRGVNFEFLNRPYNLANYDQFINQQPLSNNDHLPTRATLFLGLQIDCIVFFLLIKF